MDKPQYLPDTAGELMATQIPSAQDSYTASETMEWLAQDTWDDISMVYVLSSQGRLLGQIPLSKIVTASPEQALKSLIEAPKLTVSPQTDQEEVVIGAVRNNVQSVPVIDEEDRLLGVVTAKKLIDVLHTEHLEDMLRLSGIEGHGSILLKLAATRVLDLVTARLPWLVVGAAIVLIASVIASWFEGSLQQHIALVFFMPVIVYVSDAVGTQTETIFIRSLTIFRFNFIKYMVREWATGAVIGGVIGILTGIFALVLSGSLPIAFVVGLSLLFTVSTAAALACLTPAVLNTLGKDPAIGSGPFTTAIQDLVSLTLYFVIAAIIL